MQKTVFSVPVAAVTLFAFIQGSVLFHPRASFGDHVVTAEYLIGVADQDGDGRLSASEVTRYLELYGIIDPCFETFDRNKDGNLSAPEINMGVTKKDLLAMADKNGDGKVTLYEAVKFLAMHGVVLGKQDMKAFDGDADGFLSVAEVNRIPQKLFRAQLDATVKNLVYKEMQGSEYDAILAAADGNKDCNISLVEFAKAVNKYNEGREFDINAFELMSIDLNRDGVLSEDELEEFRENPVEDKKF